MSDEELARLRDVANRAITKRDADGRALEGTYIQWDPQLLLALLDVYAAAKELVDSWYSGEEGPAYLALRDAVQAVR
jgi:hypothetical protein